MKKSLIFVFLIVVLLLFVGCTDDRGRNADTSETTGASECTADPVTDTPETISGNGEGDTLDLSASLPKTDSLTSATQLITDNYPAPPETGGAGSDAVSGGANAEIDTKSTTDIPKTFSGQIGMPDVDISESSGLELPVDNFE